MNKGDPKFFSKAVSVRQVPSRLEIRKTYTAQSTKLFLALNQRLSRINKTLKVRQRTIRSANKDKYVAELERIVQDQRKRIEDLEKRDKRALLKMRWKVQGNLEKLATQLRGVGQRLGLHSQ